MKLKPEVKEAGKKILEGVKIVGMSLLVGGLSSLAITGLFVVVDDLYGNPQRRLDAAFNLGKQEGYLAGYENGIDAAKGFIPKIS